MATYNKSWLDRQAAEAKEKPKAKKKKMVKKTAGGK